MMIFSRLFGRPRHDTAVTAVYEAIVAVARHPKLYAAYGVTDTIDGRYDMIILHAVLLFDRLKQAGEKNSPFAQQLTDYLFADMDRSLREMGVGDLSVGKKVRRMAEIFYGRATAYAPALEAEDHDMLQAAIRRNVFPGMDDSTGARHLTEHAFQIRAHLRDIPVDRILAGDVSFPEPSE